MVSLNDVKRLAVFKNSRFIYKKPRLTQKNKLKSIKNETEVGKNRNPQIQEKIVNVVPKQRRKKNKKQNSKMKTTKKSLQK